MVLESRVLTGFEWHLFLCSWELGLFEFAMASPDCSSPGRMNDEVASDDFRIWAVLFRREPLNGGNVCEEVKKRRRASCGMVEMVRQLCSRDGNLTYIFKSCSTVVFLTQPTNDQYESDSISVPFQSGWLLDCRSRPVGIARAIPFAAKWRG